MEAKALAFHKRVRQGYLELAHMFRDRYLIIDADQPEDVIQKEIQARIMAIIAQKA